jgi:hypothetical protein
MALRMIAAGLLPYRWAITFGQLHVVLGPVGELVKVLVSVHCCHLWSAVLTAVQRLCARLSEPCDVSLELASPGQFATTGDGDGLTVHMTVRAGAEE